MRTGDSAASRRCGRGSGCWVLGSGSCADEATPQQQEESVLQPSESTLLPPTFEAQSSATYVSKVKNLLTGHCEITSQNHGFQVDETSLPANVRVTHRSLFDGTVQGIELTDKPAYSFQGHPEASPGPHDVAYLFDKFIKLMAERK